jgi:hypothetical protein
MAKVKEISGHARPKKFKILMKNKNDLLKNEEAYYLILLFIGSEFLKQENAKTVI